MHVTDLPFELFKVVKKKFNDDQLVRLIDLLNKLLDERRKGYEEREEDEKRIQITCTAVGIKLGGHVYQGFLVPYESYSEFKTIKRGHREMVLVGDNYKLYSGVPNEDIIPSTDSVLIHIDPWIKIQNWPRT
jgi:hypothetical protein